MKKGILTRKTIHEILHALKNNTSNYDKILKEKINIYKFEASDINMIQNVVLESIRHNLQIVKIIKKYAHKKINEDTYLLLLSSITQLIYLDFKDYAVVNSTVELAKNKKFKSYPGFINAILKKIKTDKKKLKEINIEIIDLPRWIREEIIDINILKKKKLISAITEKPDLHLVFKTSKNLNDFLKKRNHEDIQTSELSVCVKNIQKINNLPNYEEGNWWVQDFSAMLPLFLSDNLKNKDILDMCAAPGGKSFQILTKTNNLEMIEKNPSRAKILYENLRRLKFNNEVIIKDATDANINKKYDLIIIDAPCSSIGTIRKNPEIIFRDQNFKINEYIKLQKKLLSKASKLLKKNGEIIYMVCSFFKIETSKQIEEFLKLNNNFSIKKFSKNKNEGLIDNHGYINIMPETLNSGIKIDGFFAAKLIKNV